MAGIFTGADEPVETAPIAAPPAAAPQPYRGNIFEGADAPVRPPPAPGAVDWSKLNQPLGTLKAPDYSPSQAVTNAAQDALIKAGAQPYTARHLAEGATGIANMTPLGSALSGADLPFDISRGNYGHAAMDVLGASPAALATKRLVQGMPTLRMADTPARTVNQATGAVNDELLTSARGHYRNVAQAPIAFQPGTMGNFTDAARMALQQPQYGAFTPEAAQGVHALLTRWGADFGPNRVATPHDFDVLRQQLRGFEQGADSAAGPRAAGFVDQFLGNPPPAAILRAPPGALDTVRRDLAAARGDYRAGKTAETVGATIDYAGTRAGGANSGLNVGNQTRQALGSLVNPPPGGYDKIFGASYPERQSLRDVVAGDWLANKSRYISNRMGGGGGFTGTFGGGIAGHTVNQLLGGWGIDPVTATAAGMTTGYLWPKVGEQVRQFANERTVHAAEQAVEGIRRNSPLYRARAQAAPDIVDPRAMQRDAIAYAMAPQLAQAGRSAWDQAHVPYPDNREQP